MDTWKSRLGTLDTNLIFFEPHSGATLYVDYSQVVPLPVAANVPGGTRVMLRATIYAGKVGTVVDGKAVTIELAGRSGFYIHVEPTDCKVISEELYAAYARRENTEDKPLPQHEISCTIWTAGKCYCGMMRQDSAKVTPHHHPLCAIWSTGVVCNCGKAKSLHHPLLCGIWTAGKCTCGQLPSWFHEGARVILKRPAGTFGALGTLDKPVGTAADFIFLNNARLLVTPDDCLPLHEDEFQRRASVEGYGPHLFTGNNGGEFLYGGKGRCKVCNCGNELAALKAIYTKLHSNLAHISICFETGKSETRYGDAVKTTSLGTNYCKAIRELVKQAGEMLYNKVIPEGGI